MDYEYRPGINATIAKLKADNELMRAALEPFAHCVHNDNGEVTVTTSDVKPYDYFRAYRALRPHDQSATASTNPPIG